MGFAYSVEERVIFDLGVQVGSEILFFSFLDLSKHCSCRQIRRKHSKTAHAIRTLYTALGRGQARSVHYTWYFGRLLQSIVYSAWIAKSSSDVSRIVVGARLLLQMLPLKSQMRSIHYTRYIWAVRCDPYTIYITLEHLSEVSRIVYGSRPTPPKCCI